MGAVGDLDPVCSGDSREDFADKFVLISTEVRHLSAGPSSSGTSTTFTLPPVAALPWPSDSFPKETAGRDGVFIKFVQGFHCLRFNHRVEREEEHESAGAAGAALSLSSEVFVGFTEIRPRRCVVSGRRATTFTMRCDAPLQ